MPINADIIDNIEKIKLANINPLEACLPPAKAPIKATTQITASIDIQNIPPTPLFTN